jgi:hypothetical protein
VCKLERSLYGLKQSPRAWNTELDGFLKEAGFVQTEVELCLYKSSRTAGLLLVGVYVDDLVIAGESLTDVNDFKKKLQGRFESKDLGPIGCCLGLEITQDVENWTVKVKQSNYIRSLLIQFGMEGSNAVSTPLVPGSVLARGTVQKEFPGYRSLLGGLLYLSGASRPDIAFAVSQLAGYCNFAEEIHWAALKRVLRYLKGTANVGLVYGQSRPNSDKVKFLGYSDSDWGADSHDRRSVSGVCVSMAGAPVVWSSRKQSVTAVSTMEAEYVAASEAAKDLLWVSNVLGCLSLGYEVPILYIDNQAALLNLKEARNSVKLKHVAIRFHFARSLVQEGKIQVEYCPTAKNVADLFTKALVTERIRGLSRLAGLQELAGGDVGS